HVVLLWNKRKTETSPFLREYDEILLRYGTDYKDRWSKERTNVRDALVDFFTPCPFGSECLDNTQPLGFEGLKERALSSSYAPLEDHPNFEPMIGALRELFEKFQQNGQIAMEYETAIFWGRL